MKAELTLKLGNKLMKLAGEGNETVIMKALSFWSQLPEVCTNCKSTSLSLFTRATDNGDYYGIKCLACGADFTFHQHKKGGFYVTKEDKFKVYVPQNAIEGKSGEIKEIENNTSSEDIPF